MNLNFVPKSKSFFNCGWRLVSFRNSLPQSSFRGPSSHSVVLQKRLLLACLSPGPTSILQLQNHVHGWLAISEDYIANSLWGVGGSQYVGVCPRENLPVFKIQRLECLSLLSISKTMKKKHCSNFILRIYKFFFLGRRGGGHSLEAVFAVRASTWCSHQVGARAVGAGLWSLWSEVAGNAKLVYYYSLAVCSSVKLRWPA